MNDILIRQMAASDIEAIAKDFCPPWTTVDEILKTWEGYYQEQKKAIRTVGILEKNGQILGYGSLLRQSQYPHFSNMPEIQNLWIDEDHRSQGLGKRLITWLEELARGEGYKQIGIGFGLYADYGPAQKLYYHLGYAPDGHGITYKYQKVIPGEKYPVDDDLILWLTKSL